MSELSAADRYRVASPVRSFDFRPIDAFDCFLALEFSVEVFRANEVLRLLEPAFAYPLDYDDAVRAVYADAYCGR